MKHLILTAFVTLMLCTVAAAHDGEYRYCAKCAKCQPHHLERTETLNPGAVYAVYISCGWWEEIDGQRVYHHVPCPPKEPTLRYIYKCDVCGALNTKECDEGQK